MAEVHVDGARRLRTTLRKAGATVEDLKAINNAAARIVAEASTATAPVGTPRLPPKNPRGGRKKRPYTPGRLRQSIRAASTQRAGVIKAGGYGVKYAGPIHWGWRRRNIRPHPWMANAAKATEPEWVEAYNRQMIKAVNQVKGK